MKKYKTNKILIAQLDVDEIPDDILERISGYQLFDGEHSIIYSTKVLHKIINDKEDDTNDTTKSRIKNLYAQIKNCAYFQLATI